MNPLPCPVSNSPAQVGSSLPPGLQEELLSLVARVSGEQSSLLEAVRRGEASSPRATALARSLTGNIGAVAECIQGALVDRVVEDFIDIATPLKHFTDCVLQPGDPATREQVRALLWPYVLANTGLAPQVFDTRAASLQDFSGRAAATARLVATGNTSGNKKLAEALLATAGQVRHAGEIYYL